MMMIPRLSPRTGYVATPLPPRQTEVVAEEPPTPPVVKPIEKKEVKEIVPWVALGLGVLNLAILGIGWKLLDQKIQELEQTVQQQKQTLLDTMEQKAEQFVQTFKAKTLLERKMDRLKIEAAEVQTKIVESLKRNLAESGQSSTFKPKWEEQLVGWQNKDITSISSEFLYKYRKYGGMVIDPAYDKLIKIKEELEILQRQLKG